MPSPFPGMDPHIEAQRWEGFHTHFIVELAKQLVPLVRPGYVVETEERIYVEQHGAATGSIRADDAVEEREAWQQAERPDSTPESSTATITPVVCVLPMDDEVREVYLTVRERESRTVVTVIEMFSPGNKRVGSDGREQYLRKRRSVLQSACHLVEIDLLRGGARMPTVSPLPRGDYFVFVCRAERRPEADVFPWSLRQQLPAIPIPLADGDPDVTLDLQALFDTVYDGLGYDYALDYSRQVVPPLSEDDAAWAGELVRNATST